MSWLITAAQADKFRKSQKSLIIFDASLHLPDTGRNAEQEFQERHIVGAQFFDIDAFRDSSSNLPHKLIQDDTIISEKLSAMGVRNDFKIIFYDNSDLHSACRALWMMKVFGHNPNLLYVIDGGLNAWEKKIGKIESGKPTVTPKPYKATFQPHYVRTLEQMKENLIHPHEQVVDLRHPVRYSGGPEIRENMRSGHIPGSFSLPYSVLFDKNNQLLPLPKLRQQLTNIAVDTRVPIVATCGAGVTAPILDFILDLLGHSQHAVYDGSWAEWGRDALYPGEKSLDERPVKTCTEELVPREHF